MIATIDRPALHITSDMETITPELAAEYLKRNTKNRRQRRVMARVFASMMRAGKWFVTSDAIAFDWHDRLMNGQHRLLAIAESGVPQLFCVMRGLDPAAYSALDGGLKRSVGDHLEMLDVPHYNQTAAIARRIAQYALLGRMSVGIAAGANSSGGTVGPSTADVLEVALDYPVVQHAAEFAAQHKKQLQRLALSGSTVGTLYALYAPWHGGIHDFLHRMISAVGLTERDPALAMFIRAQANAQSLKPDRMPQSTLLGYLVLAANHDYHGNEVSKLQWRRDDSFPQPAVDSAHMIRSALGWPEPTLERVR
jgi:hypothetical protein